MNIDDMIRLAHEAGWKYADGDDGYAPLWEFGKLVEAEEREACAKLCIEMASWHGDLVTAAYDSAADAIRKRGQG
jgi:hypothetical protein